MHKQSFIWAMCLIVSTTCAFFSSCNKNKEDDPTPPVEDVAPHWVANPGNADSHSWTMVTRDDEPIFMTITASIPDWSDYMGYNEDYMAVLDCNDSVIGLNSPERFNGRCAQLYVVAPSDKNNLSLHLCFFSLHERQYYAICPEDEEDAAISFENMRQVGSISSPYPYQWHASGRYTRVGKLRVRIPGYTWKSTDELSVWAGEECRATFQGVPSAGSTESICTLYVPLSVDREEQMQLRFFCSDTRQITTHNVDLDSHTTIDLIVNK